MIRYFVSEIPRYKYLVLPHPVESVDGLKKLIGDTYPNIIVNREGTISGWLRNSLTIIHNGCTSALEVNVSEVNRIAYRPLPHPIEREIPNRASIHAMNLEELSGLIDRLLVNTQNGVVNLHEENNVGVSFLKMRFGNLNDKLAADRIVDEWEKIGVDKDYHSTPVTELLKVDRDKKVPLGKTIKSKLAKVRNTLITRKQVKNSGKLLE